LRPFPDPEPASGKGPFRRACSGGQSLPGRCRFYFDFTYLPSFRPGKRVRFFSVYPISRFFVFPPFSTAYVLFDRYFARAVGFCKNAEGKAFSEGKKGGIITAERLLYVQSASLWLAPCGATAKDGRL
jgi:hypothetical protein